MSDTSHESPTQELSWFSLLEHQPRHEDARSAPDPVEEVRRHEDVVDADDVSVRSAGQVRHRRPNRTRFQIRGH